MSFHLQDKHSAYSFSLTSWWALLLEMVACLVVFWLLAQLEGLEPETALEQRSTAACSSI